VFFSLQFFYMLWNTATYTWDWYCHLVGGRASFCYISLTFAFALDDFKSLLQNFSLVWTSSKCVHFRLGDGKSLKSQYPSYLDLRMTRQVYYHHATAAGSTILNITYKSHHWHLQIEITNSLHYLSPITSYKTLISHNQIRLLSVLV
jgi:hypothetical protein